MAYWIQLHPNIGRVLVADQGEEAQVRSDYDANVLAQAELDAQVSEENRTMAENDILAQAAMIKAERKK